MQQIGKYLKFDINNLFVILVLINFWVDCVMQIVNLLNRSKTKIGKIILKIVIPTDGWVNC